MTDVQSPITTADPDDWAKGFLHSADLDNAGPDFKATVTAWFAAAISTAQGLALEEDHKQVVPGPSPNVPDHEILDYMGTDAQRWAGQFLKRFGDVKPDMGDMISWFANALERAKMEQAKRSIPQLAFDINSTAHHKGWWKDGRTFDGVLMLIVSEAAEALEDWRNNHREDESWFTIPGDRPALGTYFPESLRTKIFDLERTHSGGRPVHRTDLEEFNDNEVELLINSGHLKPEGIPSELADIIIRVFDCAAEYGIDIEEEVINKMAYNATRAHKHGGKRA